MVPFAQMRQGEQVWFRFVLEVRKMGSLLDLLEIPLEHPCRDGK